jgi:hypothetical protein
MAITTLCRTLGKRRLATLARMKTREDWAKRWPKARHAYPFSWGECWKAVAEFGVKDYAAELGFHLDILGLELNASWDDHAMLKTPDGEYAFTIYRAKRTAPELNLQFMLGNIEAATAALTKRRVTVVQELTAEWGEANPMRTFKLTTPNGVLITLWGFVAARKSRAKGKATAR